MIENILLNKWFYSFVVGWILFFILIDWTEFSKNIWGGIVAMVLELWQDGTADKVGLYYMKDRGISLFNIPIFFTFGVVFTMGVLFIQYLPKNPKLQLIHIIAFASGFLVFELIVTEFGLLVEPHWNHMGSFFDNIIIMGSLVWLKQYILYRKT